MCSFYCIYSPVNKGFVDEISYLRSHNRFESTCKKIFLNYTDYHDVDEELRTITRQGGRWSENPESYAGIMFRYPLDTPSTASGSVASKNNHTLSLLRKSV